MSKILPQNKFLLTMLLVCFLTQLYAQKTQKFYDYKMQECDRQSARFLSIVIQVDSGYCRKIYYVRERKLQMLGYFKDSLLQIKNGKFHYYHSNGFPKTFGRYVNGKKEGLWYGFHDNRIMSDSTVYEHDNQIGGSLSWYPNGQLIRMKMVAELAFRGLITERYRRKGNTQKVISNMVCGNTTIKTEK
jgi:antitoxin component YwqK of YwqJK toxin-antitoxin module